MTRQDELKIWCVKHKVFWPTVAEGSGYDSNGLCSAAYSKRPISARAHAVLVKAGIPERLLPPVTQPKGVLLEENRRLKRRVAELEARLAQGGAAA